MRRAQDDTRDLDVVDLLIRQHQRAGLLLADVGRLSGDDRHETFQHLVHLLAAHETAEEVVVYPVIRANLDDGHGLALTMTDEEHQVKCLLADLEAIGPDSASFPQKFSDFTMTVLDHFDREERHILPALRTAQDVTQLGGLATALSIVESVAPTHGHRHAPTGPLANIVLGTPIAIWDRLRDVVRRRHIGAAIRR
jgi:hemerythrin superfamily protein